MKKTSIYSIFIVLFTTAFASISHAADAGAAAAEVNAKLREALRTTTIQLRNAQNDLATLQAAQADKDAKLAALQKQSEALVKQTDADKEALAVLTNKVADRDAKIADLTAKLNQTNLDLTKAIDVAKKKEAERAKLSIDLIEQKRVTDDRETKNYELFKLGNEILTRYEKFGFGEVITGREPFIGVARVKLQNLVQDYQDKLLEQKIRK